MGSSAAEIRSKYPPTLDIDLGDVVYTVRRATRLELDPKYWPLLNLAIAAYQVDQYKPPDEADPLAAYKRGVHQATVEVKKKGEATAESVDAQIAFLCLVCVSPLLWDARQGDTPDDYLAVQDLPDGHIGAIFERALYFAWGIPWGSIEELAAAAARFREAEDLHSDDVSNGTGGTIAGAVAMP